MNGNNIGNPTVSIILPIYNGERYISAAIESVRGQSYGQWELLIIDDGSTDNSAAICEEYSNKDARIKVFHQSNNGVNSARAKGVDIARGSYLTFLDADDALPPHALDYMTGLFHDGVDLVANGIIDKQLDRDEYVKALWEGKTGLVLWGKMFRASLFKKVEYALDRRIVMGEDLLLNSIYALGINTAYLFSKEVYLVNRNNETSVTRSFKHNWEYEKLYFNKVDELFLSKCRDWNSYDQIRLLVNKSWLNAMKYVMLDGGRINYADAEFKVIQDYFRDRTKDLGLSEKLIFLVRNPYLYRTILKSRLALMRWRR